MSLVQAGSDVVVDTALVDARALTDAARCFAPVDGLFVGMRPPLAVSEQWEQARGDRPLGQVRQHYALVHAHGYYDLVFDPSQRSPQQCAAAILQRLQDEPLPTAFQLLMEHTS